MGEKFPSAFASASVNMRYLYIKDNEPTSLACIFEPSDGEIVFYVCPGARHIPASHLPDDYVASAKIIFLTGHMMTQDETTCQTLLAAVKMARQCETKVVFDPGKYWLNTALESYVFEVVSMADLVLPNQSEAQLLTNCTTPSDSARSLLDMGAGQVAITLGKEGCLASSSEGIYACRGGIPDVKSALGAGDAFTSGFLHGSLQQLPLVEMAHFANATAAIKIQTAGPQQGLPDAESVLTYLNQHPPRTSVI